MRLLELDKNLCGSAFQGAGDSDTYELEEGEWIPPEDCPSIDSNGNITDEGAYFYQPEMISSDSILFHPSSLPKISPCPQHKYA